MKPNQSFTSGEWQIGFNDRSGSFKDSLGGWIVSYENDSEQVVIVGGEDEGIAIGVLQPADARLICAAPHLYTLLKQLVEAYYEDGEYFNFKLAQECEDILAQVEGVKE